MFFFSPTYKEEEEESRLQDFTDDDELENLSTGSNSSPRLSPSLLLLPAAAAGKSKAEFKRSLPPTIVAGGGRVPSLGLAHGETEEEQDNRLLCNSAADTAAGVGNLAQSHSNLSQLDGSVRSESSDRFRDSIDTVVRVSLASPQDSRTSTLRSTGGPGPQLECIFR
jgi:hypothetical protein